MPQSLTVGGGSSSGSSVKRQRSTDGRDIQGRTTGTNKSNGSLLRPNVRIPSYLDKSKSDISQAFQDLEWKQRFRLFHALENPSTSPFRVDRSEIVISRNRYGNVQPWDNSRVRLKTPFGGSDYVNASPIALKSRGIAGTPPDKDGNASEEIFQDIKYIATQGPKEAQIAHFWHMVMQETTGDTGVIVMLTQCYEANKEKCTQYFPENMNSPAMVLASEDEEEQGENIDEDKKNEVSGEEGDEERPDTSSKDVVTLKSVSYNSDTGSQVRILNLEINNKSKTIYHYLFHGWPDFGKPEAEERQALVELTRQTKNIAGDSPRIIHCSAGVGRTGTFIALDFLTREIEEGRILDTVLAHSAEQNALSQIVTTPTTETWGKSGPPKVKTPTGADFASGEENHQLREDLIYDTVNTLREQRMMMVMNELQYSFLYEVIREVFFEKYKARPEGAVVKGAEEGSADLPRGKVPRVEKVEGEGSGSEAETEIMEGDEDAAKQEAQDKTEAEGDPYDVVAPEHIREGVMKDMQ